MNAFRTRVFYYHIITYKFNCITLPLSQINYICALMRCSDKSKQNAGKGNAYDPLKNFVEK